MVPVLPLPGSRIEDDSATAVPLADPRSGSVLIVPVPEPEPGVIVVELTVCTPQIFPSDVPHT